MAERYRPETESQEMAFLVGEITSVVQVQVQGIDPEKNMRRDVHEYEVDEETIYRFDYTFEDGIKPKVKIEINRSWVDLDLDSAANSQQSIKYFIDGFKIRKEASVDHRYVSGRFMEFRENPTTDKDHRSFLEIELYKAPAVSLKEVRILRDIIVGGKYKLIREIELPTNWPKEKASSKIVNPDLKKDVRG